MASHEGPKQQQHHCTLLATGLDPKYGPDSKIEQGQEKYRQVMTILCESSKKLDLNIGSVMQNWSDYQYKVTFSTAHATCLVNDVVLRHTLPVFTGLGRCPIVNWDFAGAVSIFGPDALPVVHQ